MAPQEPGGRVCHSVLCQPGSGARSQPFALPIYSRALGKRERIHGGIRDCHCSDRRRLSMDRYREWTYSFRWIEFSSVPASNSHHVSHRGGSAAYCGRRRKSLDSFEEHKDFALPRREIRSRPGGSRIRHHLCHQANGWLSSFVLAGPRSFDLSCGKVRSCQPSGGIRKPRFQRHQ